MTDTVERRVDRLERDFVEIHSSLERIERTLVKTQEIIARIQRNLARSVAPVGKAAPDGTVAIRDPGILAQQQRTQMRGYSRPRSTPSSL